MRVTRITVVPVVIGMETNANVIFFSVRISKLTEAMQDVKKEQACNKNCSCLHDCLYAASIGPGCQGDSP